MPLASGTRLGPYEVTAQIGAGGMGEVYRARDTKLGRDVALKILPDAFAHDPDRLARFQREAHVLASLNHPNIAQVYGLEDANGTHALVMELVEGPTLADRIAHGALSVNEALAIAKQIAEALEAAHEQGIIHRDLKPANVKVREDGTVKVLDFGLAKALEPAASSGDIANSPTITSPAMTQMGMILGTAAYMSPEQAKGRPVDKRADIWAFGVVLFEMLTGRRAFEGEDVSDVMAAVLKTEPDWSLLPADVPQPVRRLLRRCLEKDPKRRLRDIGEGMLQLHDGLSGADGLGFAGQQADTPAPGVDPDGMAIWRRRAVTLFPWAALLVAVAFIVARTDETTNTVAPTRQFDLRLPEDAPLEFIGEAHAGSGQTALALSRDGALLAYVGTWGETTRLYLRDLKSGRVKSFENTDGAYYPFFNPVGDSIAFFAASQLKKVQVATGQVTTLAEAPNPYGGDWNEQNEIVMNTQDGLNLILVSGEGGPTRYVPIVDESSTGPMFPKFLPGSEWVIGSGSSSTGLRVRSTRTGEVRTLTMRGALTPDEAGSSGISGTTPVYVPTGHLLYARGSDGVLMALPFDIRTMTPTGVEATLMNGVRREGPLTGSLQLAVASDGTVVWAAGSDGRVGEFVWAGSSGPPEKLPLPPAAYGDFNLSPDRRWLAAIVTGATGRGEIRFFDLQRSIPTPWSDQEFVPTHVVWEGNKASAIAGSRLSGFMRVWRDNSSAPRLVGSIGVVPWQILDDGTVVASVSHTLQTSAGRPSRRSMAVSTLLPDGGMPSAEALLETRITDDGGNHAFGFLSPDRQWLSFSSTATGPYEVYVVPAPFTGPPRRISTDGGDLGLWSPDSKRLYYRNGRRWYVVERTSDPAEPFSRPAFFLQGNYQNVGGVDFAVSADGQRLLLLQSPADERTHSLHVITNWFDEIRRVAPAK